jgi:hypothetical protein
VGVVAVVAGDAEVVAEALAAAVVAAAVSAAEVVALAEAEVPEPAEILTTCAACATRCRKSRRCRTG